MNELAIQPKWTEEDKSLIKETVAKGTSESEFKLFLYTASKYGLDPLIKQVWCIKYSNAPAAIFCGRDGFLHIAHESGKFNGMETVSVIDNNGKLIGAKCSVWRKDMERPFVVEVPLSEYNTEKSNWLKMPSTMLKKVAESQCLRKAFDISGLYAPEEYEPEQKSPIQMPKAKEVAVNGNPPQHYVPEIQPQPEKQPEHPKEPTVREKVMELLIELGNGDPVEMQALIIDGTSFKDKKTGDIVPGKKSLDEIKNEVQMKILLAFLRNKKAGAPF